MVESNLLRDRTYCDLSGGDVCCPLVRTLLPTDRPGVEAELVGGFVRMRTGPRIPAVGLRLCLLLSLAI